MSTPASTYLLARCWTSFGGRNPQIKVTVQRTLASRISDEVAAMHSVELGVLSVSGRTDAQVKSMVVYRDELGVCGESAARAGEGWRRYRSGSWGDAGILLRTIFLRRSGRR